MPVLNQEILINPELSHAWCQYSKFGTVHDIFSLILAVILFDHFLFDHFYRLIWVPFPIQKWPLFSHFHVF